MTADEEKAAVLSPADFKRLLRNAQYGRNGKRNPAIIWMSFGSALRVTEIAHLQIKDIMKTSGELLQEFRLPGAYTKNGDSRVAYMLEPDHQAAVDTYLNYRIERRLRATGAAEYRGLRPDSPLFLARGAEGFSFTRKEYRLVDGTTTEYSVCSSMQQLITTLIKETGIKGGSSHSGRRTFATRLADRGIDLDYIKYFLGHKSRQQTLAYIDGNPARARKVIKAIYGEL